ncbi:Hypothetical predicted protein [Mytilus galloprovincialis]|uniref:Uncharacterized protein n=1 Tax=Mytilus galloprovincialis TaxID=29158 RepID=A0A8B6D7X5_MYTGA|nr:Hypothetical predicted protein [Mytilus galloprovincialis]
MGPGKTFTPTDLQKMALKKEQHNTELTIIEPFLQTCEDLKNARTSSRNKEVKFFCTEINCISSFNTSLELEENLDVGFHSYILEQESTYDKIKKKWGQICTSVPVSYLSIDTGNDNCEDTTPSFVSKGWALRQQRKVVRFSPRLRNHLQTIYKHGTDSGIHADPYRVSESLTTSRDGEGKKEFEKEDWISPQQIASFFSRCTYQKNVEKTSLVKVEDTSDDADLEEAITEMNNLDAEKNMVEMRKEILESLKDD